MPLLGQDVPACHSWVSGIPLGVIPAQAGIQAALCLPLCVIPGPARVIPAQAGMTQGALPAMGRGELFRSAKMLPVFFGLI